MDINQWLKNIPSVSPPAMDPQSPQAAAAPAAVVTAPGNTPMSGDSYFRVGRRTTDDVDGDTPTEYIVIAKIDAPRQELRWLSVATWQFNGLRIGSLEAGDCVKEDDESLDFSTGLDPDPYFFARNLVSLKRIREHLFELVSQNNFRTSPETYEEEVAQAERDQATWARMVQESGPGIIDIESMRSVAGQDPKQRFPHPWALPAVLTDSWDTSFIGIKPGPTTGPRRRAKQERLSTFNSFREGHNVSSINVIVVFVNNFDDKDLRLKHFVEVHFDAEESVESAREYFLEGDGATNAKFGGLNNDKYLSQWSWSLELWVLPQMDGCTTLIPWDDVPQVEARRFCDWRAIQKDEGKCGTSVHNNSCDNLLTMI